MRLSQFFGENPKVALGFSGGVDSAYLLYAGLQTKADIRPYYVKTVFQPSFETQHAIQLAKQLNVKLTILEYDILSCPSVTQNLADRCYRCKSILFGQIQKRASQDGYPLLIEGTNASDDPNDRPGMKAIQELSVRSPLCEYGFKKEEVRRRSRKAGLFTWNLPSYSCLATRVQKGQILTEPLLNRIEKAENALFQLGFRDFRVRISGEIASLEFVKSQLSDAMERKEELFQEISPYFDQIEPEIQERRFHG